MGIFSKRIEYRYGIDESEADMKKRHEEKREVFRAAYTGGVPLSAERVDEDMVAAVKGRMIAEIQRRIIMDEQRRLAADGSWGGPMDGIPRAAFAETWQKDMDDICTFYDWLDMEVNREAKRQGLA